MERKLILLAGGSGAGKSTVAKRLVERHPGTISVLHLDDFFVSTELAPRLPDGTINWDTPLAIDFERLRRDAISLLSGKPVTLATRSEIYNPEYILDDEELIYEIQPAPIILVEGFLALCDSELRKLASCALYLYLPLNESLSRRTGNKFMPSSDYIDRVLRPMHEQFVEPSKKYADAVISVEGRTVDETIETVEKVLHNSNIHI